MTFKRCFLPLSLYPDLSEGLTWWRRGVDGGGSNWQRTGPTFPPPTLPLFFRPSVHLGKCQVWKTGVLCATGRRAWFVLFLRLRKMRAVVEMRGVFFFTFIYSEKIHWEEASLFAGTPWSKSHSHTQSHLEAAQYNQSSGAVGGYRALLKGSSVMVMREGQALIFFTFPTQDYPAEPDDHPVTSLLL